jgi:hypothetical protein
MSTHSSLLVKSILVALFATTVAGCIPVQSKTKSVSEPMPQNRSMKDWLETRYDQLDLSRAGLAYLKNASAMIEKYKSASEEDKKIIQDEFIINAEHLMQTGVLLQSLEKKMSDIHMSTARQFDEKRQIAGSNIARFNAGATSKLFAPFATNNNLSASDRASMVDAYTRVMAANTQAAERLANLRNLANVQALDNRTKLISNQRQFMDVQGVALENVGRAINNQSGAIGNALLSLDIPIKQLYIATYNAYRAMFTEYSRALSGIYKRMDKSNRNFALAQRAINQYQRQVQLCESRKSRLNRQKNRLANEELFARNVELNSLTRGFNYFTKTPIGEACLHKSLLTWNSQDLRHLFDIEYKVEIDDQGKKPIIACAEMSDAFPGQIDPMEYPQPILDLDTFEPIGFYQPVTHYQIFRVLTETSMDFRLQNPPMRSQGCNRLHPGVKRYFDLSREFESSLAEDSLAQVSTKELSGYNTNGFTPRRYDNQAYTKLMQDFATIFATADMCQKDKATESELPLELSSEDQPFKATDSAVTDMNSYFDPNYALYSESIRSCMQDAEHLRYKAFAFLTTQEKMVQVLNMAASMTAPQAPMMPQSMIMPQQPRR